MPIQRITRQPIYPIGPSIAYIPLTRGMFSLVDADRAAELCVWNWYAFWSKGTNSFYAYRGNNTGEKWFKVGMHAAIMGTPKGMVTDHKISGETLNNHRTNLRIVTVSQNNANRRTTRKISPAVGVSKMGMKYKSQISIDGKARYLGLFSTLEEASSAYKRAFDARF